jgi:hypothetical protein
LPRRSLGEDGFFSAVPVGLDVFPIGPGIEMPGYFRWFLRNRTLRKNGDAPDARRLDAMAKVCHRHLAFGLRSLHIPVPDMVTL